MPAPIAETSRKDSEHVPEESKMITVRKSDERGYADHGWLKSQHTFSFANYYDPEHVGFSDLRVINEDRVMPSQGFGQHSHRDMEIISYVLEDALEHKDSIGNGSVIRPGDVQRMTAGHGITHSEFNHSGEDPLHFLQIWIKPETNGLEPGYEQKSLADSDLENQLHLVASRDGRDDSLTVHQDVNLYVAKIEAGKELQQTFGEDRKIWVQVAEGKVEINGHTLEAGDGAAIVAENKLKFVATEKAEILVFDLRA